MPALTSVINYESFEDLSLIHIYNLLTFFSELNDMDIDPEGTTGGSTIDSYPNVRIFKMCIRDRQYLGRFLSRYSSLPCAKEWLPSRLLAPGRGPNACH